MSLFEYPLRPVSYEQPYVLHRSRRVHRPVIHVRVSLPRPRAGFVPHEWVETLVDTGADCCAFSQDIADRIGLERSPGAEEHSFRTASGTVRAWLTRLNLHLGLPAERDSFDWEAIVAIVPGIEFNNSVRSGLLGIGGGLELFNRLEFILNPAGPEMPVVRIVTP